MALRVGCVGCRGIGTRHAECYDGDELADLVAVCDVVRERADSLAERFGIRAYYDLSEMLDGEPDLDIVDVSTGGYENGSWHYEPAMIAMEVSTSTREKPLRSMPLIAFSPFSPRGPR